jgi:hypothetical protein
MTDTDIIQLAIQIGRESAKESCLLTLQTQGFDVNPVEEVSENYAYKKILRPYGLGLVTLHQAVKDKVVPEPIKRGKSKFYNRESIYKLIKLKTSHWRGI